MRPPGAKRGAAPFGGAESHELRWWARLRRAGCAPAPCLPPTLSPHTAFAPSPPAPTQTPALTKPLSPPPPQAQKTPPITKHPAFAHPAAPAARAPNGAQPHSAPPKATSFARGPACGGRAAPLPPAASPNAFPSRCFRSLSRPPATFPNAPSPKNSPAAFHRLRGSVHLWYFVPALMEQARYSCSHSSTRAS